MAGHIINSPRFNDMMSYLMSEDGKPLREAAFVPFHGSQARKPTFLLVPEGSNAGHGRALDPMLRTTAVQDHIWATRHYLLAAVEIIPRQLAAVFLVPKDYTYNELIQTIEIALVYMLGRDMLDKRPTIAFPQIRGSFFRREVRDKLGDEITLEEWCSKYTLPHADTRLELVIRITSTRNLLNSEEETVKASREFFLNTNAKKFLKVEDSGRVQLAQADKPFFYEDQTKLDKIRLAWKSSKKVTQYPVWNVRRPILEIFSLEELEEAAMHTRAEDCDFPVAVLVEKKIAYNKLLVLTKEAEYYNRMDDMAYELAVANRKPIDHDLTNADIINKLPVFTSKTSLSVSRTWADLELKCRFILQQVWTWLLEMKKSPYKIPVDMLVFRDSYEFAVMIHPEDKIAPARYPPPDFIPIRGQGQMIYIIYQVFPSLEIIPMPETISLLDKEDLRRSFKQFCRVSVGFNMPSEIEKQIEKIKSFSKTEEDLADNREYIQAAYGEVFKLVTSYMPDETSRVITSWRVARTSDMQRAIAYNIDAILDSFGVNDPEVPASLIYSKWAQVYGTSKTIITSEKLPIPPAIAQVSRFRAAEDNNVLTSRTSLFDGRKKIDFSSEHKNRCKSHGCSEFSSFLPLCEYHAVIYGDIAARSDKTSSVPSLQDEDKHAFATERISMADSYNVISPRWRARFYKEVVAQLQGQHSKDKHTPAEALWCLMLRYGPGVENVSWGCPVINKNKPLLASLAELDRDYHKIKRAATWMRVDSGEEGNLLVIELRNSIYATKRKYGRLTLVGKTAKNTLVEKKAGDDQAESHQDDQMRRVFNQIQYADVEREVCRKARIATGNMLPQEMEYLRQLTHDLGVQLVVLVTHEADFNNAKGAFQFHDPNRLNGHITLVKKTKTSASSTIQYLEKHTSKGSRAALLPVSSSPLLQAYPPTGGDNSTSWNYLANFVLGKDITPSLAVENLVGPFNSKGKKQAATKERELDLFWFNRFLYFMSETDKLADVCLHYGDIQISNLTRDTVEPTTRTMDKINTFSPNGEDQKAQEHYRKRVLRKTPDFPFTNELMEYGQKSLVQRNVIPESKLRRMAITWNEMHFGDFGSIPPHEFAEMWNLEGVERTSDQLRAAAEMFDRKQIQLERRTIFEKGSELRRELRVRALEEAEKERDRFTWEHRAEVKKDWWAPVTEDEASDSDEVPELEDNEVFPAVNNNPLQPVDLEEAQQNASNETPLPEPDAEEEIFLGVAGGDPDSGVFSNENVQAEPDTPAGTVPDASEVDKKPELTEEQVKRMQENARIALYKQEMMDKIIKKGGRWDPEKLGVTENLRPENDKMGISILRALAEVRILTDKLPDSEARLQVTNDPTDVIIINELSKNLTSAKAAPDILKLAKATKCTIVEVAERVAKLNLSGVQYHDERLARADPGNGENRQELEAEQAWDFDHRADMAPSAEARAILANVGIKYDADHLVAHDKIKINFDQETRILIKRAASLLSFNYKDDKNNTLEGNQDPLLLANTAAAYLVELLILDAPSLTQYLACLSALDGSLVPEKIRQAMFFNILFTNRQGKIKQWAIHFLPHGSEKY